MNKRKKISGIYLITSPSNKIYVGQSWDINKRWNNYKNLQCKGQIYLYNSLLKYDVDNHKFEIVEHYFGNDQNELDMLENSHWNKLKSVSVGTILNIKKGRTWKSINVINHIV